MNIAKKIKAFFARLQNLPENRKKVILWVVVGILAFVMGFFWVRGAVINFSKISEGISQIKIPALESE